MEQNCFFPEVRGNFGLGCIRLPMNGKEVDKTEFCRMANVFIAAGFNYFDTTHGYIRGKSEMTTTACVSSYHPRERFLLTNKLIESYFEKWEDIRPLSMQQFAFCKVGYFDFHLMHAQNKKNYQRFKRCRAYGTAGELKQEGYIRHLGLSFHDKAEVLDMILNEHPETEFVQTQFNYLDYKSDEVKGRKAYEVCEKYQKPVMVMESVKGGSLVKLPEEADRTLRDLNGGSDVSYTIRFATGFPQIAAVLFGMSNLEQMEDNLVVMCDFKLFMEAETEALREVCAMSGRLDLISCTACHYCVEEGACPENIRVPETLGASNAYESFRNPNMINDYRNFMTVGDHGKAADYIRCGKCKKVCPQHLEVWELPARVATVFDRQ